MDHGLPDDATIRAAVARAARAPSVHNSQPWQWRLGRQTLHLYADPERRLPGTDPAGRDLVLSCGAALHHLRISLTLLGWRAQVHRLPDPAQPHHLAAIELHAHTPTHNEITMATAIATRRSDRRWRASWPVARKYLEALALVATHDGTVAFVPTGAGRRALYEAIQAAARMHADDPEYRIEIAAWSGRHAVADGVPAASTPKSDPARDPLPGRTFTAPELTQPPGTDPATGAGTLLVLATASDDRMAWLRAGEATSAVLLTATALSLASCPLTEPLEICDTRAQVGSQVCEDNYPQMVIRLGWAPSTAAPLIATLRRPVSAILQPLTGEDPRWPT